MHETYLHFILCWLGIEGLQVRASLDFSRLNGIKCKLSNVITSSQRHSRTQCFTNSSGLILSTFTNSAWISFIWSSVRLFDLILYVPSTIFRFIRDESSWLEQVQCTKLGLMCLAQGPQRSDTSEAWTHGPSVSSQALFRWATAHPLFEAIWI